MARTPAHDTLVVICNWNKRAMLDDTLRTLDKSGPREYDVLVVDNASTDDSVAMVREKHPWAEVHQNAENLGGTGGFNTGMAEAVRRGYKYFWLMDNDIIVHPGAYRALRRTMDRDDRVALVGCQVRYYENPAVTQEVGGRIDWRTGRLEQIAKDSVDPPPRVHRIDYASACSLFARVAAVKVAGIWDPGYFITWDDVDWCVRMRRMGYRVVATSRAIVRHASFFKRRPSQGLVSNYYSVRNALYFFRRNARAGVRLRVYYGMFRRMLGDSALFAREGQRETARALRAAMADFFAGRMGKCPHTFNFAEEAERTLPFPKVPMKPRILLFGTVGKEFIAAQQEAIESQWPDARVTVFLDATHDELVNQKQEIPGARVVPFFSLGERMRFLREARSKYDVVVAPHNVPRFFFEDFLPVSIRWNEQCTPVSAQRGGAGAVLRKAMLRAGAAIAAVPMAVAATVWRLPAPEYFGWEDAAGRPRHERQRIGLLGIAKVAVNYAIALMATALVTPVMVLWWKLSTGRR